MASYHTDEDALLLFPLSQNYIFCMISLTSYQIVFIHIRLYSYMAFYPRPQNGNGGQGTGDRGQGAGDRERGREQGHRREHRQPDCS